jgi:hypothetical protein
LHHVKETALKPSILCIHALELWLIVHVRLNTFGVFSVSVSPLFTHSPNTQKDLRICRKKFKHTTLPDYFKRTFFEKTEFGIIYCPRQIKLQLLFFVYFSEKNMLSAY